MIVNIRSSSNQLQLTIKEEFVLLALSRYKENYGLALIEVISNNTDANVYIDYGTMYPILDRLNRRKLIEFTREGEDVKEERKGRKRKYYSITPQGTAVLERVRRCRDGILNGELI